MAPSQLIEGQQGEVAAYQEEVDESLQVRKCVLMLC